MKLGLGLGLTKGGKALDGSMKDVVSSSVLDLDATNSDSYSGSGTTWANLVTSPADGSDQTDYDFHQGDGSTSTTYPTFTGSAGDSGAYWLFDGGDYFDKIAANTDFLNSLNKTTGGSDFWIAVTGKFKVGVAVQNMLSTMGDAVTSHGIMFDWDNLEGLRNYQRDGSTAVTALSRENGLRSDFVYCVLMSFQASDGSLRMWINGVRQANQTWTFNTSTTNPFKASIGAAFTPKSNFLANGSELYGISMGNGFIGNSEEASIRSTYETRHARSYTRDQSALSDSVTGVVWEISAHNYESVWESGTATGQANNIISSPSDGETQSAYDFPSAVGNINYNNFPNPEWTPTTSSQRFQLSANTTFINNLHKTTGGSDFTFGCIIDSDGAFSTGTILMATASEFVAGNEGIWINLKTNERLAVGQIGSAGFVTNEYSSVTFTSGQYLIICSYSHSNNNWRIWINSTTAGDVAQTFSTSTGNANGDLSLHAATDGSPSSADPDWIAAFMLDEYIDNTKAADIFTHYETVTGYDFTP